MSKKPIISTLLDPLEWSANEAGYRLLSKAEKEQLTKQPNRRRKVGKKSQTDSALFGYIREKELNFTDPNYATEIKRNNNKQTSTRFFL